MILNNLKIILDLVCLYLLLKYHYELYDDS